MITLQMPQTPREQLHVIAAENDPEKSQRRTGVVRLTVDVPAAHATAEPRPSRWRSYEFFVYYFVFILCFPWMVYVPIHVSSSACPFSSPFFSFDLGADYSITQRHFQIICCIDTGWPKAGYPAHKSSVFFVLNLLCSLTPRVTVSCMLLLGLYFLPK